MYSFGFIGCGSMGGTLALAVAKARKETAVSDSCAETAEKIGTACGAAVVRNSDIAKNSRFIVLGVKPHILPAVVEEIAPVLKERGDRFTVISMAAGVSTEKIKALFGFDLPIIRIMPNTPAAVGEGMIVYSANALVTQEEKTEFEAAFTPAGDIEPIAEELIDAATGISGCGPAFVYMFIEALADGGVRCGLPRSLAQKLAAKTVSGSAQMVMQTKKHPGELKDAVCSPGGSTIEGVQALEKNAFRGTVAEAVSAAFERTKKLSK